MRKKKDVFSMSERLSREYYGKKKKKNGWSMECACEKQETVSCSKLWFTLQLKTVKTKSKISNKKATINIYVYINI